MSEHILFLTGSLAEKQVNQVLESMQPEFSYTVHQLGLKVAALMTTDMVLRRLKDVFNAGRIIVPGRCRGDIATLAEYFGIPVERGPEEIKDLPRFFGQKTQQADLSQYSVRIFAEITDAPYLSIQQIIDRAQYYQQNGADIIDVGCIPDVDFPHMVEAIRSLKQEGFKVSVDSLNDIDLLRGGKAGADYLLSLTSKTLWIADEVDSIPIIIPEQHGDLSSLNHAVEVLQKHNRDFIVDPILDPIHFGFTESIVRNYTFRQHYPDIEMMLGVGNLTELTHADTSGMNAMLMGICSELNINNILATEVSQHACRAIKEADVARRIMHNAKQSNALPKHVNNNLMTVHETSPFPYTVTEIQELANNIKDPSYRIQTSEQGLHIFNRNGMHTAQDPFTLYPELGVEKDGGHAFYLGVELARAEIAWQLGKRFTQDESLDWGCASAHNEKTIDLHTFKPAGTTLNKK